MSMVAAVQVLFALAVGGAHRAPSALARAQARASARVAASRVRLCAPSDDDMIVGKHVDVDELANERLVRIVQLDTTDEETNELAWRCLGYMPRGDGSWDSSTAFAKWRDKFPQPPDLIGITRDYSRAVDEPVMRANQALHRSIPMAYKQQIKEQFRPLGWTGFKLEGLTPNMTRRAQVTNWLLYYREALHGRKLSELKRRQEESRKQEEEDGVKVPGTGTTKQSVM
mmetsp:Transcript_11689/g.30457  ORF Transcript_11689/g.30457 Transcript_11689/m.30457 type:complete len:227 (-) Transcript_11689:191-871(-)